MRSIILLLSIAYLSFYCNVNAKPQPINEVTNDLLNKYHNTQLDDNQLEDHNELKDLEYVDDVTFAANTNITTISYTGPSKYQLDKYNKLMSYSYYPNQPMSRTVPPAYVNTDTYFLIINDPVITDYIDVSGFYYIGFHKIVYYVNFQNKEFVVTIVPVNTTSPYKAFTCFYNNTQTASANDNYKCYPKLITSPGSTQDCFFMGYNVKASENIYAIAAKVRYIQQEIFEKLYLRNNGPKSEWTFTIISKDTGNNAAMYFIYNYYWRYLSYSYIGGLNRIYVNSGSGYKAIQQMGFGNLKDKLVQSPNSIFQYGNYTGSNIFMTVAGLNDLLSTARYTFNTSTGSTFSLPTTAINTRQYYNIDSLHRTILYNRDMESAASWYYKCNKYRYYIDDYNTFFEESDLNGCHSSSTILRQYFGLPNYFYRYSVWYTSDNGAYTYDFNDPASFISYHDHNYDICTAYG